MTDDDARETLAAVTDQAQEAADQVMADAGVFAGPALARHVGITYRQLDYWVTQGWLKPTVIDHGRSGRPAGRPGTGYRRIFMGLEVTKAEHMGRLVRFGTKPSVAAAVALQLAETGEATFGPYRVTFEAPS